MRSEGVRARTERGLDYFHSPLIGFKWVHAVVPTSPLHESATPLNGPTDPCPRWPKACRPDGRIPFGTTGRRPLARAPSGALTHRIEQCRLDGGMTAGPARQRWVGFTGYVSRERDAVATPGAPIHRTKQSRPDVGMTVGCSVTAMGGVLRGGSVTRRAAPGAPPVAWNSAGSTPRDDDRDLGHSGRYGASVGARLVPLNRLQQCRLDLRGDGRSWSTAAGSGVGLAPSTVESGAILAPSMAVVSSLGSTDRVLFSDTHQRGGRVAGYDVHVGSGSSQPHNHTNHESEQQLRQVQHSPPVHQRDPRPGPPAAQARGRDLRRLASENG